MAWMLFWTRTMQRHWSKTALGLPWASPSLCTLSSCHHRQASFCSETSLVAELSLNSHRSPSLSRSGPSACCYRDPVEETALIPRRGSLKHEPSRADPLRTADPRLSRSHENLVGTFEARSAPRAGCLEGERRSGGGLVCGYRPECGRFACRAPDVPRAHPLPAAWRASRWTRWCAVSPRRLPRGARVPLLS